MSDAVNEVVINKSTAMFMPAFAERKLTHVHATEPCHVYVRPRSSLSRLGQDLNLNHLNHLI
jgi:hypothetical protein